MLRAPGGAPQLTLYSTNTSQVTCPVPGSDYITENVGLASAQLVRQTSLKLPINLIPTGNERQIHHPPIKTSFQRRRPSPPPSLFPRQLPAMLSRQALRSVRAAAPQRVLAVRTTPVRSFAAAASAEVHVPKAVFGLDGTYATALVWTMPFAF